MLRQSFDFWYVYERKFCNRNSIIRCSSKGVLRIWYYICALFWLKSTVGKFVWLRAGLGELIWESLQKFTELQFSNRRFADLDCELKFLNNSTLRFPTFSIFAITL